MGRESMKERERWGERVRRGERRREKKREKERERMGRKIKIPRQGDRYSEKSEMRGREQERNVQRDIE